MNVQERSVSYFSMYLLTAHTAKNASPVTSKMLVLVLGHGGMCLAIRTTCMQKEEEHVSGIHSESPKRDICGLEANKIELKFSSPSFLTVEAFHST